MAEEPQKNRELHLQERRVILDEKKLLLESRFLRRNLAVTVTFLAFLAVCVITLGVTYSSYLAYQAEVADRRLDSERALALSRMESQRESESHLQAMDLKLAELALSSPAAKSSDPAEVARLLTMINHLFPLAVRQRAIEAMRASAKPDAAAMQQAIDAAEKESLKLESDRKKPNIFIFAQSAEDLPGAEKVREALAARGWRAWVADPVEPARPVIKVEVRHVYTEKDRAERIAKELMAPLQSVKAGLELDIDVVSAPEFSIAGGREGNFEVWLPRLSGAAR